MTGVDIELGQQTRLALQQAILLYQDEGRAFATLHAVSGSPPTLEPGHLLTLEDVHTLHCKLHGETPLEVLPETVLALSSHKLVWYEKPRKRVLFFQSSDACLQELSGQTFPQPALVFVASLRSLQVYALGGAKRPSSETPLYAAPYYNTSRATVCLGSTALPMTLRVADKDNYSRAFFASAFTHGTAEQLLRGWGGSYGEFWGFVKAKGRFPSEYLVPFGQTLGEVLCQRTP
jgi:PRTRC genetic system protein B